MDQTQGRGKAIRSDGGTPVGPSTQSAPEFLRRVPQLSLPAGGGAIRGIGEKFASNPVTGTSTLSVPIPATPGRSGFGPHLALSYDSGSGNGPFGFGWDLGLPAIRRKTDKGLPRYRDSEASDVFVLSGSEDLVPVLDASNQHPIDTATASGFAIEAYRPRVEGAFARIERWTHSLTGDTHWRSITRDNVTSLYGTSDDSRVYETLPAALGGGAHVFSWLLAETFDDRGNTSLYQYQREDPTGVDRQSVSECNREDAQRRTNRYPKRVLYGNTVSRLDVARWPSNGWLFELVFDYGEHDALAPTPTDAGAWILRNDPLSTFRPGFEVRTYRLCQRILMFHHFPDEPDIGRDCLVRSLDLTYRSLRGLSTDAQRGEPRGSFVASFTQCGYRRQSAGGYLRRTLPPLELDYSKAVVNERVETIPAASLENAPVGIDSKQFHWLDLMGEGVSGIFVEEAGAWFYKRNLSPALDTETLGAQTPATERVSLAPLERIARRVTPHLAPGSAQLLDLEGDGRPDVVMLGGPTPGFFEFDDSEADWSTFRPFLSRLNVSITDPNLRFIDLDGDGRADALLTENDVFTWYPSQGEEGFGPAQHVSKETDEDRGPRVVFADGTDAIYLADMNGDGLTDIVRVRNGGGVCYWPNRGYGKFGARVQMSGGPFLEASDQFDQRRVRLADIDGTGAVDLIYLAADGVQLYFNVSGNAWSSVHSLTQAPAIHDLVSVAPVDLFGNGTACLLWSSALPGDSGRQMRYIDLMGGRKPHLLTKVVNNLGSEKHIAYASSAKFYVRDRLEGHPWVTRLPFPVHVVETIETIDRISGNRFVTRFAYHHGHFDAIEREFCGFGLVEQWDTEDIESLRDPDATPATNLDTASHVPPVLTRTWYHTGAYFGRDRVSNYFAGLLDSQDRGDYYREPAWRDDDAEASRRLLEDTILPAGLTVDEEREAARALRGSLLRQEVYGLDRSAKAEHPYQVLEQNFSIETVQRRSAGNRHAVFFIHSRESLAYDYERNPDDPRVVHNLVLEVDGFGNPLRTASVAYGRRVPDASIANSGDQNEQTRLHVTAQLNRYTAEVLESDAWRTPLPSEARTFELTGLVLPSQALRFTFDDIRQALATAESNPSPSGLQLRLLDHVRTLYRSDNLAGPMPLHHAGALALRYETYRLALTPELLTNVFATRVTDTMLAEEGGYVHSEGDANWWLHSGQMLYSPDPAHSPADELSYARQHFFLGLRYRDPFYTTTHPSETLVTFDRYDLLLQEIRDALGNRMTAGERDLDPSRPLVRTGNDYRVLQPVLVMDANRNRSAVAYDALGLLAGTAAMGKPEETLGDSLDGFQSDLSDAEILAHLRDPFGAVEALADPVKALGRATTRVLYDLFRYSRSQAQQQPEPSVVYTLAREVHDSELVSGQPPPIRHAFVYSDGFGREIQRKVEAEPGPVPARDPNTGRIILDNGRPRTVVTPGARRWTTSGWTIYDNKGQPIRRFEPFLSDTHAFDSDVRVGVASLVFYDPPGRVVATLHPNHSWEKVVFDSWSVTRWDVNDCADIADPATDADIGSSFARIPNSLYLPGWVAARSGGQLGVDEQLAADRTRVHASTPTHTYLDSLGREFLTVAENRWKRTTEPAASAAMHSLHRTRIVFDIAGHQLEVIDANDRSVVQSTYDLAGNRLSQSSMDAGAHWLLQDVGGMAIRRWDSRGHITRLEYDLLRRPTRSFVRGTDPQRSDRRVASGEVLFDLIEYGEGALNDVALNLRTRAIWHCDGSGVVRNVAWDFKGNLIESQRQLAHTYKEVPDWSGPVALEPDIYVSHTTYDAFNRPTFVETPDRTALRLHYSAAKLLDRVDANIRADRDSQNQILWTAFITSIEYDARGQRERIQYANGVETRYGYDPDTFRLVQLYTRRGPAFTEDCGDDPPPPRTAAPSVPPANVPCGLQNLTYTYDPAGNLIFIRDAAQQTLFFRNRKVEASNDFNYDALYRLIEGTGREHFGRVGRVPVPHSYNDLARIGLAHPGDGTALGRYHEDYEYDDTGNLTLMAHQGLDPASPGWSRNYEYLERSLLEPALNGNRLTRTTLSNDGVAPLAEPYAHDAHGNITRMPQLQLMDWDFLDRLQCTQRQAINTDDVEGSSVVGERTYYVYDSSGQRTRKVTETAASTPENPIVKDERIYLGACEIYRRGGMSPITRETVHIMDGRQRIARVESRTAGSESGIPPRFIRFGLGNHLGSAVLELDDAAQITAYEEYSPFGSTTYRAARNQTEAPNLYRYTAKERDRESGLSYHGARYCAVWLGRWTSADPSGLADGTNLYTYVRNNPVRLSDPTGHYSWGQFGSDVVGGVVGVAKGIAEPVLIVADFGQMGAALVTHAVAPKYYHDVQWLSATGRRIEGGDSGLRAGLVVATAMPTGGATVLADNIAQVFEKDMTPDQAQSFLVQGAVGQVVSVGMASSISRASGQGWTGRGPTSAPEPPPAQRQLPPGPPPPKQLPPGPEPPRQLPPGPPPPKQLPAGPPAPRQLPAGEGAAKPAGEAPAAPADASSQTVPVDLFRGGNSRRVPSAPRPGKDIEVSSEGTVTPSEPGQEIKGASTFADAARVRRGDQVHRLPAGTELPEGLRVTPDGADVGGPRAPSHHTISPSAPMSFSQFVDLVLSLPWQYVGKQK